MRNGRLIAKIGGLALAVLMGCRITTPADELIRHPSYEIYDESDMSTGNFFSYSNDKLTLEGNRYDVTENPYRDYILDKSLLDNVFAFISKKTDMQDGTDIFTSRYNTAGNDGFYGGERINGRLINDRIYLKPVNNGPFVIPDTNNEISYINALNNGIINIYSTALHEYAHQIDNRADKEYSYSNEGLKRSLTTILGNDFGIITREPNETGYEHITDMDEVYANMFKVIFYLKFKDEFEQHIANNYIFKKTDSAGNVKENVKLTNLDINPVLELILYTTFRHKEVDLSRTIFTDNRELMKEKLERIRQSIPSLEQFFKVN